jgi:hypothetical protein
VTTEAAGKKMVPSIYVPPAEAEQKLNTADILRQAVLIYGSCGFGKTTLIRHYLKDRVCLFMDVYENNWTERFRERLYGLQNAPEVLVFDNLHLLKTQEEYDLVKKRADECGMTVSRYTRKCTLGHQPKYHLTDREIEAYDNIADARGDIVHFFNVFNDKSAEERQSYFKNATFMRGWIQLLTQLAADLEGILNKRKE